MVLVSIDIHAQLLNHSTSQSCEPKEEFSTDSEFLGYEINSQLGEVSQFLL